MRRRFGTGRWAAVAALGCVAALTPVAGGLDAVGAVAGSAVCGPDNPTACNTFTTSTKHVTTTLRVDLEDAAAPECDFPGSPAALVGETTVDLDPVLLTTSVIGPATIHVGEDESQEFVVAEGTVNFNTRSTFEKVVTQYFQAVAPGEACVVVAAARFTG